MDPNPEHNKDDPLNFNKLTNFKIANTNSQLIIIIM